MNKDQLRAASGTVVTVALNIHTGIPVTQFLQCAGGEMAEAQREKLCRDRCSVSTFVCHCSVSTLFCLYAMLSNFQAASLQGSGHVTKFQPASVLPSLGPPSLLPPHPLQQHRSPERAKCKYQQRVRLGVLKAIKSKVEGWV